MSAELSITIGLLSICGLFIFLGEKLLGIAKKKNNSIIFNIGVTSWFASGVFFTVLLFLLWQFASAASYAGVVKAVFLFFIVITGLVCSVGFFIMMILLVMGLYGSIAEHFNKKRERLY